MKNFNKMTEQQMVHANGGVIGLLFTLGTIFISGAAITGSVAQKTK